MAGRKKGGKKRKGSPDFASSEENKETSPFKIHLYASPEFCANITTTQNQGVFHDDNDDDDESSSDVRALVVERSNLENFLSWFKLGVASEPTAKLKFSPDLAKDERAYIHRVVSACYCSSLETASEGVGESRSIFIYAKDHAPKRELSVEDMEKAGLLYRLTRSDARLAQLSRDEILEAVRSNKLPEELQRLWLCSSAKAEVSSRLMAALASEDITVMQSAIDEQKGFIQLGLPDMLSGELPLVLSSRTGRLEAVRALLHAGAPIDARDSTGRTALQVSRTFEQCDVEAVLLQHGAHDPEADVFPMSLAALRLLRSRVKDLSGSPVEEVSRNPVQELSGSPVNETWKGKLTCEDPLEVAATSEIYISHERQDPYVGKPMDAAVKHMAVDDTSRPTSKPMDESHHKASNPNAVDMASPILALESNGITENMIFGEVPISLGDTDTVRYQRIAVEIESSSTAAAAALKASSHALEIETLSKVRAAPFASLWEVSMKQRLAEEAYNVRIETRDAVAQSCLAIYSPVSETSRQQRRMNSAQEIISKEKDITSAAGKIAVAAAQLAAQLNPQPSQMKTILPITSKTAVSQSQVTRQSLVTRLGHTIARWVGEPRNITAMAAAATLTSAALVITSLLLRGSHRHG